MTSSRTGMMLPRAFSVLIEQGNPFVADHRVHGVHVLPGVVLLDLTCRALEAAGENPSTLSLRRVVFLEPVVVTDQFSVKLTASFEPRDDVFTVRLEGEPRGPGGTVLGPSRLQAVLEVEPGKALPHATMPFQELLARATERIELDEVYALARATGILHGPFMQPRGEIRRGPDFTMARLELSPDAATLAGALFLHPVFLDSATLLPLVAVEDKTTFERHPFIPLSIDGFRARRFGGLSCYVLLRREHYPVVSGEDVAHVSMSLYDTEGAPLAEFQRLSFKRIRSDNLIRELRRLDRPPEAGPVPQLPPASPAHAAATPATAADYARLIETVLAEHTSLALGPEDRSRGFYDLGLMSIDLLAIVRGLEQHLGRQLYPTLLFEHSSIELLAAHLSETTVEKSASPLATTGPTEPQASPSTYEIAYFQPTRPLLERLSSACPRLSSQARLLILGDPRCFPAKAFAGARFLAPFAAKGAPRVLSVLDPGDPESTERALASALATFQRPEVILHAWTLTLPDSGPSPQVPWAGALILAQLVRNLVSGGEDQAPRIVAIGQVSEPSDEALEGLFISLRLEHPRLSLHLALLERDNLSALPAVLARELSEDLRGSNEVRSYFRNGELRGRRLGRVEAREQTRSFRTDGVYLVSGAGGALGRMLCTHLERRYLARVAMVDLPGKVSDLVADERRLLLPADVTDPGQVEQAVQHIVKVWGKLDGVLHVAGLTRDGLLRRKPAGLDPLVLAVKIQGLLNLDLATAHLPLELFLAYSSATALLGNVGQADYAYANSFLLHFCRHRETLRRAGTRRGVSVAVAWPLWREGSMWPEGSTIEDIEHHYGVRPLSEAQGLTALETALDLGPEVLVFPGKLGTILSRTGLNFLTDPPAEPEAAPRTELPPLARAPIVRPPRPEPVAVIGLAGRYPGSNTLEAFWHTLTEGLDRVEEIPASRWPLAGFYDPDRHTPGRSYCKWGGFLADPAHFDPRLFGISPKEARIMDPQERLLLETAWEVLEEAGYAPAALAGREQRVGVFIGAMWNDYRLIGLQEHLRHNPVTAGGWFSTLANRISHVFDFSGPSLTVDTACSSALLALHLAVESLRKGHCTAALAGGVNLCLHPDKYLGLSQLQMLSPTGRCRAFGLGADGYVPAEGVGLVLLKPLSAAQRDGDHVHALILATAVNHAGRTAGFSVPSPASQAEVLAEAITSASVPPSTITYLEAHGTGTSLGDPIEFEGIRQAFSRLGEHPRTCVVGSVKSNLGHAEAAAGIAGLTKVILQLEHRELVPSLHLDPPNPALDLGKDFLELATVRRIWPRSEGPEGPLPLRAGLSAFGAGGTNVHVILEEAPAYPARTIESRPSLPVLVVLSAKDEEDLRAQAGRLADLLRRTPDRTPAFLQDLTYTLQTGRAELPARLGLVTSSVEDAACSLERHARGEATPEVLQGRVAGTSNGNAPLTPRAVQELVDRGELQELLNAWLQGTGIPWACLHDAEAHRLSLPTYPFRRRQYWVSEPPAPHPQEEPPRAVPTEPILYYRRLWTEEPAPTVDFNPEYPVLILLQRRRWETGGLTLPSALSPKVLPLVLGTEDRDLPGGGWELDRHGSGTIPEVLAGGRLRLSAIVDACDLDPPVQRAWPELALRVRLFQGLLRRQDPSKLRLLHLSRTVGLDPEQLLIPLTLAPLVRALGQELPWLETASLCFEDLGDAEVGPAIVRELTRTLASDELRFLGTRRQRTRVSVLNPAEAPPPLPFDPAKTQVVSGGVRGLGLRLADLLFELGCRNLILLGRNPLTEGASALPTGREDEQTVRTRNALEVIASLRSRGARVEVLTGSLLDIDLLPRGLDEILQGQPPLGGWFHCAGLLDARHPAFVHKPLAELRAVFEPKVLALPRLAAWLEERGAAFCLFCSSISSFLPVLGSGLSDYAAANGCLDGFAEELNRRGSVRYQAVNWCGWRGTGFQKDLRWLEDRGDASVHSLDDILGQCRHLLGNVGQNRVVPVQASKTTLLALLEGACQENSTPVLPAPSSSSAPEQPVPCQESQGARAERLRALLTTSLAGVLDLEPDQVEGDLPFVEQGLNSVFGVEFIETLNTALGLTLSTGVIYDHPTLEALLGHLLSVAPHLELPVEAPSATIDPVAAYYDRIATLYADRLEQSPRDHYLTFAPLREDLPGFSWLTTYLRPGHRPEHDVLVRTQQLELRQVLLADLDFTQIHAVLDLGCGFGGDLLRLLREHPHLTGVGYTLAPRQAEVARALLGRELDPARFSIEVQDSSKADFPGRFELFLALEVLCHIEDKAALLENLVRHLAPGGRLVVADFVALTRGPFLDRRLGTFIPTREGLAGLFAEAGLRLDRVFDASEGVARFLRAPSGTETAEELGELIRANHEAWRHASHSLERGWLAYYLYEVTAAELGAAPLCKINLEALTSPQPYPETLRTLSVQPQPTEPADRVEVQPVSSRDDGEDLVAITGLAACFPGAPDQAAFWAMLAEGRSSVGEIPPERWSLDGFYDPTGLVPGRSVGRWGAFLEGVDRFDSLFFSISPQEAELMDPQQRLVLQQAYRALEDAGYDRRRVAEAKCGVICGTMGNDYRNLLAGDERRTSAQAMTGNFPSIIPSRVAYHLDLRGACLTVDTACSSFLTAVHLARRMVGSGEADLMVVGAVSLYLDSLHHLQMSDATMLSPEGRCKPFDQAADGIVPGEGVGVVVLKRLADARQDGDRIYGVILGSGLNQDGKTNGLTAPSGLAQERLLTGVYRCAGVDPDTVSYIEAHGTGTPLGDPIEVEALTRAFRASTQRTGFCGLGSVKSNLGHTTAAAGAASLIKVLLALEHQSLPATLHYSGPNPRIDFDHSPFRLITEPTPWPRLPRNPRRAGISAFGFSGTNAHILVEEAPEPDHPDRREAACYLALFSARTRTALLAWLQDLLRHLHAHPGLHPGDLCRTLARTRAGHECRAVLSFTGSAELPSLLAGLREQDLTQVPRERLRIAAGARLRVKAEALSWQQAPELRAELTRLSTAYLGGAYLDFEPAYRAAGYRLCTLPPYHFEERRLWAAVSPPHSRDNAQKDTPPPPPQSIETTLVRSAGALLADEHLLLGRRVVPATALLELFRAELHRLLGREPSRLQRLELRAPLEVPHDQVTLRLVVETTPEGHRATLFHPVEDFSYAAIFLPAQQDLPPLQPLPRLEPPLRRLEGGALSALLDASPIAYGKTFRCLASVEAAEREVAVRFLPGTHPPAALLDALLHGTLLLPRRTEEGADDILLPTGLDQATFYGRPEDAHSGWVTERTGRTQGRSFDADVLDAGGRVLVRLEGWTFLPTGRRSEPRPQPAVDAPSTLTRWILDFFHRELKLEPGDLDLATDLELFGLDSILAVQLREKLNETFPDLPLHLLLEVSTPAALIEYLEKHYTEQVRSLYPAVPATPPPTEILPVAPLRFNGGAETISPRLSAAPSRPLPVVSTPTKGAPLAITGLAVRFPGADDLRAWDKNLSTGSRVLGAPAPDRWPGQTALLPATALQRGLFHAGYLEDPYRFDPLFFGLTPAEAEFMDPRQRILLEVAWHAIEDAGLAALPTTSGWNTLPRRTGVFVGTLESDFSTERATSWERQAYLELSSSGWAIANRLSHLLDLEGPSLCVDTACSSSVTALHLARLSLLNGECEAALVCGINLLLHPERFLAYDRLGVLAVNGENHVLTGSSRGMVLGEGAIALLLRPLEHALEAEDAVRAILLASAASHGGKTRGFGGANEAAQQRLVRTCLNEAGIGPASVRYLEAQLTGNPTADPIELAALGAVYGETAPLLGSVEANLGHLEGASGLAGLAKVLLQFERETLFPVPGGRDSTPSCVGGFTVPRTLLPWERSDGEVRRAAVHSVGAGGSTVHLILEEPPVQRTSGGTRARVPQLLPVSARTPRALEGFARTLAAELRHSTNSLTEVATTLQLGRTTLPHRLALVTADAEEAALSLEAGAEGRSHPALLRHDLHEAAEDRTPFESSLLPEEAPALRRLAQAWLRGTSPAWSALRQDLPCARPRIPGYPFERRRLRILLPAPVPAVPSPLRQEPGLGQSAPLNRTHREKVLALLTEVLHFGPEDLEATGNFEQLGLDSLRMLAVLDRLETAFSLTVPPTLLLDCPDLASLYAWLAPRVDRTEIREPTPPTADLPARAGGLHSQTSTVHEPIAVIGAACFLPGAEKLETFWANLLAGKELITEVPPDRWDVARYFDPDRERAGHSYSRWGGFLERPYAFDPDYFRLSEREARSMDPQQRLALLLTQHLFDAAGYRGAELEGTATAVFLGAHVTSYNEQGYLGPDAEYWVRSSIPNMIAARLADQFDLRGRCEVINTACSSSLVAVHQAMRSLLTGEAELAIAGGISLLLDERSFIGFSKAKVLSPTGHCRVFDRRADGMVLGEGAGLVLLRPLSKALAAGDRIEAVLLGSAVNNDGRTVGLTTPNPAAQAEVLRRALAEAGIRPSELHYLEAHGTGTLLGDPMELRAAGDLFRQDGAPTGSCAVGSVKAAIGHLLTAAGIASLLKAVLITRERTLPPTINCEQPHPRFAFDRSPFYLPVRPVVLAPDSPVQVGVSSFGFGGTNAHVVLRSAPPDHRPTRQPLPATRFELRSYSMEEAESLATPVPPPPGGSEEEDAVLLRLLQQVRDGELSPEDFEALVLDRKPERKEEVP